MNNQILSMEDRIKFLIEVGESHFREFKSAFDGPPGKKSVRNHKDICKDVAKTLVAFANADGGELLIGVEDDGDITGINYNDEILDIIKNASKTHIHKDTPLPPCKIKRLKIDGKEILYFSIMPGDNYCYLTSDGKCLQRKDLESVPVASEHIKASKIESTSKFYDREIAHNATLKDLNLDIVQRTAENISHGMTVEKCLQYLELAEFDGSQLKLKKAALLLFAKDANKWHPRLQVRIIKVKGTSIKTGKDYNVIYDSEERSNIINLIESGWELLRPHLTETRMSNDARFQTQIIYPELACREALINSIAHRDYSNEGRGIEITIYDDRMEIVNPGGLLSSINIDDLKKKTGVHQSRNTLIARTLREIGYMRELGEGIRRIYELMNVNDLADPELESNDITFKITLHQKYVYSKEEQLWLDNFTDLELTRNQKTVIRLGMGGRLFSTQQIWDACGIVDTEDFRILIRSLYSHGILENTLTKSQLLSASKKTRSPRKRIPKFKVLLPTETSKPSTSSVADNEMITKEDDIVIDFAKVFIGNLPYETTEEQLHDVFSAYGNIEDVFIPINFHTQKGKGFAFIEFSSRDQALKLIEKSGQINIDGRKIIINWATPPKSHE